MTWNSIIKRSRLIIIIWIVVLFLMVIPALNYNKFITYNQHNPALQNSESYIADKILSPINNDTLILIIKQNPYNTSASNVLQFQREIEKLPYVSKVESPFSDYINFLSDIFHNNSLASQYVEKNGLKSIPAFIKDKYISNDNSTFLIFIVFNTSSNYYLPNGEIASQHDYPQIEKIASNYFNSFYITGNGAVLYDTQRLTSQSGFAFGLIFIVLAIAVGITLYSYKASLLTILFVSISTLIGYLGIVIAGLLIGSVDYIVNYTLTAVLTGITTDYLVFILSMYKSELSAGKSNKASSLETANRAVKTVLISGFTVGFSLLTFSLIPGFLSWGIVLVISVLITVIFIVTFLPSLISLLGKKILGNVKTKENKPIERSFFYKTAKSSVEHKFLVIGIILILAIPSILFFINLPTTYNIQAGLSNRLLSIQGLNYLENKFGSNFIFPIFIITNNTSELKNISNYLLTIKGITDGFGPFLQGNSIVNNNISDFRIGSYYYYVLYSNYSPYSDNAINLVRHLRENGDIIVGGLTSSIIDQQRINGVYYPLLEILITIVAALVIGISFKSIKYALISISGVIIGISWSTVLLYLISTILLHQQLIYLIPVILFVILMSLGSDYSIFIISAVEDESSTRDVREAIPKAFSKTGKIVTSLGIILAISLGVLALIPVGFLEQLGIAFIIAIVLDTSVIRNFYFPAMIAILKNLKKIQ
ncbi:MMPL family transporter [Saccharolobus islandicus]|uniref:Conserved prokaryal membrane protein n=3 Tax=Saccharolobus islandicus TaxID=43080 RepID=F0NH32_SACI5|nr:MMPL family transporter [Sulfolobus islandicus]ADX82189.1 conserved prokaryal membrane protein [Sulfolobus islandicus HVE10/4]ADX84600.1 conserved prokaryal membrane protein [Sulfolobus islandicus REY15A]WCM36489.1 MMPL family transporter [Sulfolobus islandicus]